MDTKTRHGSAYDRGAADKYYYRPCIPHYYKGPTMMSERVERKDMTPEEIEDYINGYNDQIDQKDYR